MAASPSNCDHESIFHTPLLVEKILLGLPSPADVTRAALVSRTWLDTACSRRVLEKQQKQPPLLGLYFPRPDLSPGGVMSFHAASSAMSDPALARFLNRRSKPLPDILEGDPNWSPLDCRDGHLLLSKEGRRAVYDTTFGRCIAEFPQCHLQDDEPHTNTIAECLLQGHGDDRESFRVLCIQHRRRGAGLRAVEYSSHAREWRSYGWQSHLKKPSENQAMQGGRYIFWRYEACFLLILDTTTTVFSKLCVPSYLCVQYAVGDTADGRSCLITLDDTLDDRHLKLWLLEENGTLKGKFSRVRPDMDVPLSHVEGLPDSSVLCVHSVTKGIAILYIYSYRETHKRQFAVDIENKLLCGEFYSEALGYPLFMQWPPALLVKTGATEMSGMTHTAVEETEEAETKADVAEENEQLSQSSSQITVMDTQITNLRTEKRHLSRSLEEERQRASGSQQECLAIKEELARQEGRANQLEEEIKKLRARHKTELQAAAEHRELLEKEVETKAAISEGNKRSVNEQLSQCLFWITVLDTQITNLRTYLSRSLEEERQRAIKEELAMQEGRVNQVEEEIKKLRARHKMELQAAAERRELLEKELEREKASRGELEKTSSRDAPKVPLPDQTNSCLLFEGNAPLRKLWSAGSTDSLEETRNPFHTARGIVSMCRARPAVSRAPPCAVAELCTKRKKTVDDKAMPKRSRRPSVKLCGSEWVS